MSDTTAKAAHANIVSTMIRKGILAGLGMVVDPIAINEIIRISEDKFPDLEKPPTMGQMRYALKELVKSEEVIETREGQVLFYVINRKKGSSKPKKKSAKTAPKKAAPTPAMNVRMVDQTHHKFEIFFEGCLITIDPYAVSDCNISITRNPHTLVPCIEFKKKLVSIN